MSDIVNQRSHIFLLLSCKHVPIHTPPSSCVFIFQYREGSCLTHDIALIFKDDWFIRLEGDGLCTLLLQLLDCTTRQKYNVHDLYTTIRLGC